ncbi:MAG TPA: hypothetical protein VIT85_04400 [Solirubrobacterales bacterium]
MPAAEPLLSAPRSSHRLVQTAFGLYRRFPLLFFVLASGVILPYEVIVLATTGTGPFAHGSLSFGVGSLLALIELALIGPLVSAMHVHAVKEVAEGREPRLVPIARHGLRVLPVVAAATIVSWLGIGLGFLLLIIPGVLLWLRWYVVAQAAAIENEGWLPALRSSHRLTADNYGHIFVFGIYVGLITIVPTLLVGLAFGDQTTTVVSFLVGVLLQVVTWSFAALAAGLLYFDLRARFVPVAAPDATPEQPLGEGGPPAVRHPWDPDSYEDQNRPKGWYVDPSAPHRMRFWGLGDPPEWGATTQTPRKIRRAWRAAQRDESGPDDSRDEPRDWGNFG